MDLIHSASASIDSPNDAYQALMESFLRGRSENTRLAYAADISRFAEYLLSDGARNVDAIFVLLSNGGASANKTVLDYKSWMKEKGLQPSTINRRLASIRSIVKLARMIGVASFSIEVENEKHRAYRDTRGPDVMAIQKMVQSLGEREKDVRDMAILRLLFDLALRREEVSRLNIEDVEVDRRVLWVLRKGQTQKTMMTLPMPTISAIMDWIALRGTREGALFYSLDPRSRFKRITGRSIDRNVVKPLGEKVGIPNLSPHKLRHSAITEAVKMAQASGIGLEEVMDFSGHANVQTLLIYRDRERNVQGKLSTMIAAGVEKENV